MRAKLHLNIRTYSSFFVDNDNSTSPCWGRVHVTFMNTISKSSLYLSISHLRWRELWMSFSQIPTKWFQYPHYRYFHCLRKLISMIISKMSYALLYFIWIICSRLPQMLKKRLLYVVNAEEFKIQSKCQIAEFEQR